MPETEKKCKYCGREFKNRGSINLHEINCLKNPDNASKKGKKKGQECDHEWRFLNARDGREKKALDQGYYRVCNKCLEVE